VSNNINKGGMFPLNQYTPLRLEENPIYAKKGYRFVEGVRIEMGGCVH
jgi:hypothetical protein